MNKSQRYPPEVEDMRRELQSLSRKDLQTLAKQEGVKANMSSAAIIEELLRFASDAPVQVQPTASGPDAAGCIMPMARTHASQDLRISATTAAIQNLTTHRQDTGNAADQAPSSSAASTAKVHTQPAATRASSEGTKAAKNPGSGSGRKKWQVPASPTQPASHVQQPLQQQLDMLSLSPPRHTTVSHSKHAGQQAHRLPAAAAAISVQQQQQLPSAAASISTPLKLHTPMRVRVKELTAAAHQSGIQPMRDQKQLQVKAVAAPPQSTASAVTPTKQRVGTSNQDLQSVSQPMATFIRATAAAPPAAAAAALMPAVSPINSTVGASIPAGLMSPRLAVMGSARRVVSAHSRLGSTATAADHPSAASGLAAGGLKAVQNTTAAAAGPPATPLQKGARRAVPLEADQQLRQEDQQLEALVQRCLRIRDPDAPQTILSGPEPAKRWLQQHIITPWQRAQPPPAAAAASDGRRPTSATSSSSSSSTGCMAAGFCHKALLLYGPTGSGKTELVHALASELSANLLYVPAGDVLKTYQDQGHRLLRAMFKVACRAAPAVICFDDAHRSFPADARLSNPNHPSHKMLVELTVQLQQLADMQAQLQERLQHGSNKSSTAAVQSTQPKAKKPAWGIFSSSKKQQQEGSGDFQQESQQQQQQQSGNQQLAGPVVVVFATRHPEALDPSLLPLLPTRLLLDLPCLDSREDMLMAWLMAKEAAVGVQDVELLARRSEGFSCTDLLQLCQEAAIRPLQERSHRAVCMRDFEAAFQKVQPSVPAQRRAQLRAWMNS